MAKRDKKKMIRVAVIGKGKTLRGLGPNMAAINLATYGVPDPDTELLRGVSKELWESAIPRFDSKRSKSVGIPMIFGTGGGSSVSGEEYYKRMFMGNFNFQDVFIAATPVVSQSMTEQLNESIKRGEYLPQEEIVRRMSMRGNSTELLGYIGEYPLTPKECYDTINPIARESATMRMENTVKTLGEKRVKIDFNVTGDALVDKIKVKSAELIDSCETMRGDKNTNGGSPEKQRLISLAQTAYEEAAMWAVKANFTE